MIIYFLLIAVLMIVAVPSFSQLGLALLLLVGGYVLLWAIGRFFRVDQDKKPD